MEFCTMFVTFFIILSVFYYLLYRCKRSRLINMMNQFHGPPTLPILGNGLSLIGTPEHALKVGIDIWNEYESPSRLWILWKPYVMIYSAEDFQTVALKTLHKHDDYKFLAEMNGDGIFTSEVDKWKIHRRLLNSAFNPLLLKDFLVEIFNRKSQELVNRLQKRCGTGEYFDLRLDFTLTSVSTITETTMGYEEENSFTKFGEFGEAMIKAAFLTSERMYSPWLYSSFIFKLYTIFKGYRRYFLTLRDLPLKILARKRKQLFLKRKKMDEKSNLESQKLKKNFLEILLESHNNQYFTDQELKDEITSIMFGGSETTAVTGCFLILMLAMQPDIQEKVYQEIREVIGDKTRCVLLEDVAKLQFLEQCIKETLRRFPIVPLIIRYAKEDIEISNNRVIPAGAGILLSILKIHHDEKLYPNPMQWNPENFSPKKEASRHKCSFVPFSIGARNCIGQKYALVLLKIQMSIFLSKYQVYTKTKIEDVEFTMDLIIRSKYGYNVKLEKRNHKGK